MTAGAESGGAVDLRKCPVCSSTFATRRTGGSQKIYCSSTCRVQAEITRASGPARPGRGNRRPLTEFTNSAGWTLRKDVERIERIFADDRFTEHKPKVAAHLRGHLEYAAEVCQDLLSRLDSNNRRVTEDE